MSLTWAIKQIAVGRVGTPILGGGCSDHVLAQARLTGLLRCMSNLVGAMLRRLDHVLAQACYRLVAVQRRRGIGFGSQIPFNGPVVAGGCKFRSYTYTSVSRCPMSHSWFSRLWVQAGLGTPTRSAGTRTMSLRKPD